MSSLVHAKWTNSDALASSPLPAMRSLMKYSTALTSWFVVRSIALIRAASSSENFSASDASALRAAGENGATSAMSAASASASSQRTSTSTRRFMRPYSLKIGRRFSTLAA